MPHAAPTPPGHRAETITVVGIGAGGTTDLSPAARDALHNAAVIIAAPRHQELLTDLPLTATIRPLPTPLREGLNALAAEQVEGSVVVVASGDPSHYGLANTLVEVVGAERVRVIPAVSSLSLAATRMGWALQNVTTVSVCGRDVHAVGRHFAPGERLLVMVADENSAMSVAQLLVDQGFGESELTALGDLGSEHEGRVSGSAREWAAGERVSPRLAVLAVDCRGAGHTVSWAPGLPDNAYQHDGQLSKRVVRAAVLAHLQPRPGALLWDVGAGAGSFAIEWMRAHSRARAMAVESNPLRCSNIRANADRLGVPGLVVVAGPAPHSLADLPQPDAVVVGGGALRAGVLARCWQALPLDGRLVVTSVTLETDALVHRAARELGGELTEVAVTPIAPLGTLTGRRPARPVTIWAVERVDTPWPTQALEPYLRSVDSCQSFAQSLSSSSLEPTSCP